MSHTPGPWYSHLLLSVACENDGEYGDATCITNTPEQEYAATGDSGDWVAFVPHDRDHAANAALIAAAPDLLATLRLADAALDYAQAQVDSDRDRERLLHYRTRVQNVIALAEGR